MKLVEHYIMRGTRRLVLIIVGFLIFIFASYSAQRYLTEAANGTLALDVVLDIVFYKVLIALEMLLPVGLYVSVGVTLGQMYTDSEITAISAAGGSPGRLYKAVLYLAIPLQCHGAYPGFSCPKLQRIFYLLCPGIPVQIFDVYFIIITACNTPSRDKLHDILIVRKISFKTTDLFIRSHGNDHIKHISLDNILLGFLNGNLGNSRLCLRFHHGTPRKYQK